MSETKTAQANIKSLLRQVQLVDEELASSLEKAIERLVGVSSTHVADSERTIAKLRGQLTQARIQGFTEGGPTVIIDPDTLTPRPSRRHPAWNGAQEDHANWHGTGEVVPQENAEEEEVPFEELTTMERLRRNRQNRAVPYTLDEDNLPSQRMESRPNYQPHCMAEASMSAEQLRQARCLYCSRACQYAGV